VVLRKYKIRYFYYLCKNINNNLGKYLIYNGIFGFYRVVLGASELLDYHAIDGD
jgi:hypothetical protein